jgi:BetI-type transcriptional repressor, C-terminal
VHYHFGAVGNLRREAVMARIGPQIEGVAAELLDDRPVPVSIHRAMPVIDGFDLTTETGVLMAEALLQATRDPLMAEAMSGVMGSWNAVLGPRISLAQERGVVRDDIAVDRLTSVLASLLDGFLIQRMADPGLDAAQTADTIVRLLEAPRKEAP